MYKSLVIGKTFFIGNSKNNKTNKQEQEHLFPLILIIFSNF